MAPLHLTPSGCPASGSADEGFPENGIEQTIGGELPVLAAELDLSLLWGERWRQDAPNLSYASEPQACYGG